jgi:hypothetical protein
MRQMQIGFVRGSLSPDEERDNLLSQSANSIDRLRRDRVAGGSGKSEGQC